MNLLGMFYENLDESFQFWMSEMKLKVPALPLYRYPNFSVSPKNAEFEIIAKHHCLLNPIIIGEIFSSETEKYDCGGKFEAYKSISSFREYLLVEEKENLLNFIRTMIMIFGLRANLSKVKH